MNDRLTEKKTVLFGLVGVAACVVATESSAVSDIVIDRPSLELRALQRDVEQRRAEKNIERLRERDIQTKDIPAHENETAATGMEFTLRKLRHTPSLVLTDEEFDRAVEPWIGKRIKTGELGTVLNAINRLYAEKGYVVCQAALEPQRIHNGELTITLIEGVTDAVTIAGNETTRDGFVRGAVSLEPGRVANYSEMIEELVRFNMTNDVAMKIDITPGSKPETTSYRLDVEEPPLWAGAVFADSMGSDNTGRGRVGASIQNRSLFGFRDSLSLLGMASEGNKSAMLSYSVPLTRYGTRLSLSGSYGEVEIVDGPSETLALDIEGDSLLASVKIEHPFRVNDRERWTAWVEISHQEAETDMHRNLSLSDNTIDAYTLGVNAVWLGEKTVVSAGTSISDRHSEEKNFERKRTAALWSGFLDSRYYVETGATLALGARWQTRVDGETISSDYFYLGNSSGVRGYDNDLLWAPSGFTVSAEATVPLMEKRSIFFFADAGRLAGRPSTQTRSLYSVGTGVNWNFFEGADMRLTVAVPLNRDRIEDDHVDKVRVDAVGTLAF